MFRTVTAKLGNMKKAKDFVVRRDQKGHYLVQAKNVIGKFDGKGRGLLNTKGGYFHHLDTVPRCESVHVPGQML